MLQAMRIGQTQLCLVTWEKRVISAIIPSRCDFCAVYSSQLSLPYIFSLFHPLPSDGRGKAPHFQEYSVRVSTMTGCEHITLWTFGCWQLMSGCYWDKQTCDSLLKLWAKDTVRKPLVEKIYIWMTWMMGWTQRDICAIYFDIVFKWNWFIQHCICNIGNSFTIKAAISARFVLIPTSEKKCVSC